MLLSRDAGVGGSATSCNEDVLGSHNLRDIVGTSELYFVRGEYLCQFVVVLNVLVFEFLLVVEVEGFDVVCDLLNYLRPNNGSLKVYLPASFDQIILSLAQQPRVVE
jgi:hypothetical protein